MIPKLVVTAVLMVAQLALTASKKIKGPRLDDLSVSLADYGSPIPRLWGKRRLNPQIIWAKHLTEVKHTRKTKGGKFTDYRYFGSWASLICDHEIDDVSRIWFDKKLVYDRTGVGPVSIGSLLGDNSFSLADGGNMRLYTGTETQSPDPIIEAWCDDRYGADSCPAYKGSAYLVFDNIPLEQVGNRIPQITVEAINNKTNSYPYEQKTSTQPTTNVKFAESPSGNWIAHYYDGVIEWWDVANRTRIGTTDLAFTAGTVTNISLASDGIAYWVGQYTGALGHVYTALFSAAPLGGQAKTDGDDGNWFAGPTRALETTTGPKIYSGTDYSQTTDGYLLSAVKASVTGLSGRDFCIDADGSAWGLFQPTGSSNQFTIREMATGTNHAITGLVTRAHPNSPLICHAAKYNHFFVISDGKFYCVDDAAFTITASGAIAATPENLPYNNPNAVSFWDGFSEYSLNDGSLIRALTSASWVAEAVGVHQIYDPTNHAIWCHAASLTHLTIRYLDRVGSAGVTLRTVVDDVSTWCGLTGQDSTALTQTVLGYSVTQGSGKDMIAPLLDIHDVDPRPHDFSVQFVNRGGAPSGTNLTEEFVRDGDRYKVTIQQDTDLPKTVTINFADWNKDQQPNNVTSPRPAAATSSSRNDTIDMTTYADMVDSAQQKVDRYQRRLWNSRERTSLSLTSQKLALEPADVTAISLDGTVRNVRLDKMTIAGQAIQCEFVRDETSFAAVNTATTGPVMDGRDPETIFIPALTRGFVMDIPLIQDEDNDVNPLLYVAAGGYSDPWPGAFFYRGDDGTYDDQFATIDTSAESTWGLTTDTLATANPNLWDRGNSVNVTLYEGTLTTVTEAEIDADPTVNLAALGSVSNGYELVNFTTATLQGDGTYTLSGFKRGRRGTEGYTATHADLDEFILLTHSANVQMGTDDVGDALSFKAVTAGRNVDGSTAIDLTYTGASLKPYAPASVKWTYDGTDLQGTIFRRTRVGGNWNGSTIPLSEASEAYEIDVYNGATLKRTISVSGTTNFTYTAAMAAADGITLPTPPTIHAYQISAVVGRGFALAA